MKLDKAVTQNHRFLFLSAALAAIILASSFWTEAQGAEALSAAGGTPAGVPSAAAPSVGSHCPLAPALVETRARCSQEKELTDFASCAALHSLESVAAGEPGTAREIIARDFRLQPKIVESVMPFLQMLAFLASREEPPGCAAGQLQKIFELFSNPETFSAMQRPEALLFFHHVVPLLPETLVPKVEKLLEPETARSLRHLGGALRGLLQQASLQDDLNNAIENNPILRMFSPTWLGAHQIPEETPSSPDPTSPRTEGQVLSQIFQLVASGDLTKMRQTLAEAREQARTHPVQEGQLVLQAGVGLAVLGQLEDAASLLQQANSLLASAPDDENAQRLRAMGSWFLALVLDEIGLPEAGDSLIQEIRGRKELLSLFWSGTRGLVTTSFNEGPAFQPLAEFFGSVGSHLFSPDSDSKELEKTFHSLESMLPWLINSTQTPSADGPHPYPMIFIDVLGDVASGQLEDSRKKAEELVKHFPRYQNAWVLALVALEHWKRGQLEQALEISQRAIQVLESQVEGFRSDEALTAFFSEKGFALYQMAVELAGRLERNEEAFAYAERGRAWTLRRLLGSPRPEKKDRAETASEPQRRKKALLATLTSLEKALRAATTEAERNDFERELERYRKAFEILRLQNNLENLEHSALAQVPPLELSHLQRDLLPKDTVLVTYFPSLGDEAQGEARLWVWVVDREKISVAALPLGTGGWQEITCEIEELRRNSTPPLALKAEPTRGLKPLGACGDGQRDPTTTLHDRFLRPIMDRLREHQHLILVPYGPLHYLPFAALRDAESGRYLIEDFRLTLAPSVSALEMLNRRREAPGDALLVLGDPQTGLEGLVGAREEALAVAGLLNKNPLLGPQATESEVHKQARSLGILHLAAHGEYVPGHPIFSRILLGADATQDGSLTVHEVWDELDFRGTQLVTLSGCSTAIGEISTGDEVLSLTHGFLVAGSRAVLSTLWPVHDEASKHLMVAFYESWLRGMPATEALQQAQLKLLRSHRFAAPFYWAGYTLMGDPGTRWNP